MGSPENFRKRTRAAWAAGDWDSFSRLLEPVGAVVLDRIDVRPGLDLLDVGTGTGGNVAIPAALRGAKVVGLVGRHAQADVIGHLLRRQWQRPQSGQTEYGPSQHTLRHEMLRSLDDLEW